MSEKLSLNYQLTPNDYLEAKQLNLNLIPDTTKFKIFYVAYYIIILLMMIWLLLVSIIRIKYHDFWLPAFLFLQRFFPNLIQNKTEISYIQAALWQTFFTFWLISVFYPKLSLIDRWRIKNTYKNNCIQRETKNIIINNRGITIKSNNYREFREWQYFSKVRENKQIFLLYDLRGRQTTIIPKRILANETEENIFRDLFPTKIDK